MKKYIINNEFLLLIIALYIAAMASIIEWGIPNANHPFTYHMDEWHFLQAIRAVWKYGTATISGAAHIPFLHILSTGVFLIPAIILKIIDPFVFKNSISNFEMQHRIFEMVRLHTMLYGALSIFVLHKIVRDYLKTNRFIAILLFVFTPIWLSLSNYYKYDIMLSATILISVLFLFRFRDSPTAKNFVYAGIAGGLALSVKFAALPLIPILIFSYFIFTPFKKIKLKNLLMGLFSFTLTFVIFGIPDLILLKGNYYELLTSNLVQDPRQTDNTIFSNFWWAALIFEQFPTIFGRALYLMFTFSLTLLIFTIIKKVKKIRLENLKTELFLIFSFFTFAASLIVLKIGATGNRALVLLPLMILIVSLTIERIYKSLSKNHHRYLLLLIFLLISAQILEAYSWLSIKYSVDSRQASSDWLVKNIKNNSLIGLENTPIYQRVPDIALKEFYLKQYDGKAKTRYEYVLIDASSKILPPVVIISNEEFEASYLKKSSKNDLVRRLKQEEYKKIAKFEPDMNYYKIFNNEFNFYLSSLVPMATISIYNKE